MKDTSVLTLPIQRLQAATAKNPKSPLLVQLADIYVQQGKNAEVIEMLKASRTDFKGYYTYHVILAKAYTAEKDFAAARTALQAALSLAPDSEAVREALIGLPLAPTDALGDVATPQETQHDDVTKNSAVDDLFAPPPPAPPSLVPPPITSAPAASVPTVASSALGIDMKKIATAVDRIRTAHPDLVAKAAASASSPKTVSPPPSVQSEPPVSLPPPIQSKSAVPPPVQSEPSVSLPVPPIESKSVVPPPPVQPPQAPPPPDDVSVEDAFARANESLENMDEADIAALLGMADPPPPPPKPTPRPPEPPEEHTSDSLFLSARSFHLDEESDDIAADLGIVDPILPPPHTANPSSAKSFEEEMMEQSGSLFADEQPKQPSAIDSLFADDPPPAATPPIASPSAVTPPPPKAKADDSLLFADEPELPAFADDFDGLPLPTTPTATALPPPTSTNQPPSDVPPRYAETGGLKIDLNKLRQVSMNIQKQAGVPTNAPPPPKPTPPAEPLGINKDKPRDVQAVQPKTPPPAPPTAADPLDSLFGDVPTPPPPVNSKAKSKLLSADDMGENLDIDALARELMNAKMPPMTETNDATPMADQIKPVDDMGIQVPTLQLAEVFIEQGLFAKAIGVYEALSRKEPENAEVYGDIILQLQAML